MIDKEMERRQRMSSRTVRFAVVVTPVVALLLSGCASATSHVTHPNASAAPTPSSHAALPTPKPTPGRTVALWNCCAATLPARWTAPQAVGAVDESYDPTGKLEISWQVVGTARRCPVEPPAFIESLASSTHPSGDVITALDE